MKKKLVALFMALVMIFSVLPMGVFAEVANEDVVNSSLEGTMEVVTNEIDDATKEAESIKAENGSKFQQQLLAKLVRDVANALSVSDRALATTKLKGLTKKNVKNVMTLGDSSVQGCGIKDMEFSYGGSSGFYMAPYALAAYGYGFTSPEAYPAYLASKYGLSNYYELTEDPSADYWEKYGFKRSEGENLTENELAQFAIWGETAFDLRCVLEDGLTGGGNNLKSYGLTVDDLKKIYREQIKESDLVTVAFGGNELMDMILPLLSSKDPDADVWADINFTEPQLQAMKKAVQSLTKFLATIMPEDKAGDVETLEKIAALMVQIFGTFKENFTNIVADIHELNPNAKIAIMGMFNPFKLYYNEYEGDDSTKINISLLGDILFSYINAIMKKAATDNARYCCFVNCKGVEMNKDLEVNIYGVSSLEELLYKAIGGMEDVLGGSLGLLHQSKVGHHDTYVRLMEDALGQEHHAHSLEYKVIKEPNCKTGESGVATYVCTGSLCKDNGITDCDDPDYNGCGLQFKDQYGRNEGTFEVAAEHHAGEWTVTPGDETTHQKVCADCGKVLETEKHHFGEETQVDEKTHQHVCADCGAIQTVNHNFGKWIKADEKTHQHVCADCGAVVKADHEFENNVCKVCGFNRVTGQVNTGIDNNGTMYLVLAVICLLAVAVACAYVLVYRRKRQ